MHATEDAVISDEQALQQRERLERELEQQREQMGRTEPSSRQPQQPLSGYSGVISVGSDVVATDGAVGQVSRVVVDPAADVITAVVVKRGTLLPEERVVPLGCVGGGQPGRLELTVDTAAFERFDGFDSGHYREPDPDYSGPPGFDAGDVDRRNFQLSSYVAMGPLGGFGGQARPFGFPGGEASESARPARPAIENGSDVLDVEGRKIGTVAGLSVSGETGEPTRLAVRQGLIFHKEIEVPIDWVAELSDVGVMLAVRKEDVDAIKV
jgi:sporulation protein YlmC with PRC-barrel domain